jgi:predicted amidohydrolase
MGQHSSFKLAAIQMRVEGGQKQTNLARAAQLVQSTANGCAKVVVLPEAMTLGWTHPACFAEADEIPNG